MWLTFLGIVSKRGSVVFQRPATLAQLLVKSYDAESWVSPRGSTFEPMTTFDCFGVAQGIMAASATADT